MGDMVQSSDLKHFSLRSLSLYGQQPPDPSDGPSAFVTQKLAVNEQTNLLDTLVEEVVVLQLARISHRIA